MTVTNTTATWMQSKNDDWEAKSRDEKKNVQNEKQTMSTNSSLVSASEGPH